MIETAPLCLAGLIVILGPLIWFIVTAWRAPEGEEIPGVGFVLTKNKDE